MAKHRTYSMDFKRQVAPFLEQVRAPVGGLDAVAVHVRQGYFADLARGVRALGGPIAEAGSEPVGDGGDFLFPQELGDGGVAQHVAGGRGKDQTAGVGERASFVEDLECSFG